MDELNCSPAPETGVFKCKGGPLDGREFISEDDARDALGAMEKKKASDKAEEVLPSTPLSVQILAWDFSTIGTTRNEYDRVVQVLGDADIAILQEVEFNSTGETGLTAIANLLGRHLNERICKGWFKSKTGERARHAFVWRDRVISFVEKSGVIKERCSDAPMVIRIDESKLDSNELYSATFFYKPKNQMFTLASVHWDKKPKKGADKEVNKIFNKLNAMPWPLILAGDFKMSGKNKAFKESDKLDFKTALPKGAEQNIWIKNMSMIRSGVVDFEERFPELDSKEREAIASAPPIGIEISFSREEADTLKMQLLKKKPARDKASVKPAVKARIRKAVKQLDLNDDLEREAAQTETH